jgi:hypothetical protein
VYKHYALDLCFGEIDIAFERQYLMETAAGVKGEHHEKGGNHYWCFRWNRRLDRKTSGKRRVCGGGELRQKSSSSAVFMVILRLGHFFFRRGG